MQKNVTGTIHYNHKFLQFVSEQGQKFSLELKNIHCLPGDSVTCDIAPSSTFPYQPVAHILQNSCNGAHHTVGKIIRIPNKDVFYFKSIGKGLSILVPEYHIHTDYSEDQDALLGAYVSGKLFWSDNKMKFTLEHKLGYPCDKGIETDVAKALFQLTTLDEDTPIKRSAHLKHKKTRPLHLKDLCNIPFITIDGFFTQDIDDAVYAEPYGPGKVKILVAIADVSHYIKKDTILDTIAQHKMSTWYFPNEVTPMLPRELSNQYCSLLPHKDRRALVCEIIIQTHPFLIEQSRFLNAKINSHQKLTYNEVDDFLAAPFQGKFDKHITDKRIRKSLHLLTSVSNLYPKSEQENRQDDTWFQLDSHGKIETINYSSSQTPSHLLVETAMVLANQCAAQFLLKHNVQGLFRNQKNPFPDGLGLEELIEEEQQKMIQKNMTPAFYSSINEGHFGMALDSYTNFTSPIRRYPDLLVHRMIKNVLKKIRLTYQQSELAQIESNLNAQQQRIKLALNKSRDLLLADYAKAHIGETDEAHVVEVSDTGYRIMNTRLLIESFIRFGKFPLVDSAILENKNTTLYVTIQSVDDFRDVIKVIPSLPTLEMKSQPKI